MKRNLVFCVAWMSAALCWASSLSAAVTVDTVRADLNPLIDTAARNREQFAVSIAHPISSSAQGTWSNRGSMSTWTYRARIPTAVSMSFHAPSVVLPPSAVLTISTTQTSSKYVARDVGRGGLWGRPMPGDTLNFSLSVKSSEASQVRLEIASLQAGYRSLGRGVADHPRFQAFKKAAAADSTGCTENYSCHTSTANQGPAHAVVALIIGNLYQCSGTLLNNAHNDGIPYVLTARHCQSGQLGGGDSDAAATVSVYWDAVTPCGTDLGSIYDSGTINQTSATTVFEQQDAWLIRLDAPPAAADAFYAGWDASGSAFSGGYTIHHALGEDQQFVAWNGTDLFETISGAALSADYDSTYWGVVNGLGNLGAGGSGSALFSPTNEVVGSASLALLTDGENSSGVCPANPPPAPTAKSATALFTALSGVWTSTADRTSSTAGKTLKSLLDPSNTGQLTTTGVATQPIDLTASQAVANAGQPVTLNWDAQGAQSCTAWGGTPGDGWAGVRQPSGSVQLTNESGGVVTYGLGCLMGSQIGEGSTTVTWDFSAPTTNLFAGYSSEGPRMLGAVDNFGWNANVSPCIASGGSAGDGWAGPQPTTGSLSFNIIQTGITRYTLTCGTGSRTATSSIYIDGVAPYITLVADVTEIRVGYSFEISWFGSGAGGACAASGGSSTDRWVLDNSSVNSNGSTQVTETVAGTYTYTLTCTGGGQSASSSVSVTFTNDPPAYSLTAVAPQQQIYPVSGLDKATLNLLWSANTSGCSVDYTSNTGQSRGVNLYGGNPTGAISAAETVPGVITYKLICGSIVASTTIDWVTAATPNALSVNSNLWAAGQAYPITWNSASGPCVGSGGAPGDGWAGSKTTAGTQSVLESTQGTYVFTLSCGSGAATVVSKAVVTVRPPSIQIFLPGPGEPITWHSTVGPCTYVDGSAASPTGVPVDSTGSAIPRPAVSGTYLFSLTCGTGASTLYAATLVEIKVLVAVTLTASVQSAPVGAPVTLRWTSARNTVCYASGGDGNAPWTGTLPGSGSGSLVVTSKYAQELTYEVNCGGEMPHVLVSYIAVAPTWSDTAAPTVTISASASTQTQGQSISLVWSSKHANDCLATGGEQGDGWTGGVSLSGSKSVTETNPGTVTYSVTCTGAPPAATATTTIVVKSTPATTPTSSSSGGGGALDLLFLLSLVLPLGGRLRTHGKTCTKQPPY